MAGKRPVFHHEIILIKMDPTGGWKKSESPVENGGLSHYL